jgi:hypothetical protein
MEILTGELLTVKFHSCSSKKLENFRKMELYQMDFPESLNLEQMNVYAAPFGGPIAITKDFKQLTKAGASNKPIIHIFTASGRLISTINVSLISKMSHQINSIQTFSGTLELS